MTLEEEREEKRNREREEGKLHIFAKNWTRLDVE